MADSLEMARFGTEHPAQTLVVAGVRFMGETSKILNNEKRVLMPDLAATCSLDENCPIELFSDFCDRHPEHTVVGLRPIPVPRSRPEPTGWSPRVLPCR